MRANTHRGYRIRYIEFEKLKMILTATAALLMVVFFGQGLSVKMTHFVDTKWLEIMFCQAIPVAQSHINPKINIDITASEILLGFDINDPFTIITNQIASASASNWTSASFEQEVVKIIETPSPTSSSVIHEKIPDDAKMIEEITINPQSAAGYISADGVFVRNNTSYQIDAQKLINEALTFKIDDGAPQVLIVHAHASEAFTPTDKNYYVPTDPDRTEDINFNVVRVGEEIAKILNEKGIQTLHDKTIHDFPSYNGSYQNCLATVNRYLAEYPSIKVVLDIHRDAMVRADGTKLKVTTTIEGKKTAQVMIVSGSDNSGLHHPNWRENLKLALRLQAKMNELYPTLARPISLVKERYNMHSTNGALLLEVGSNGNTLEEALNGGHYLALSLAETLNNIRGD